MTPAICKGCGAEIYWIETMLGKKMPVDTPELTIMARDMLVSDNFRLVKGYESHFATCPKAKMFRK